MSTPSLTLLQYPGFRKGGTFSPPCGKVQMALRFKGLEFVTRNVGRPSEIRRHNPRGRVPVLFFGDEAVADSSDILDALERRFPDPSLEPTDPLQRAQARMIEDWADEVLYFLTIYLRWQVPENFARFAPAVFGSMPFPVRVLAPRLARREVLSRLRGQGTGLKPADTVRREFDDALSKVAVMLGASPWLVGRTLTRADLAVAAVLDQLDLPDITPDASMAIRRAPEITAWRSRIHEKAAPAV